MSSVNSKGLNVGDSVMVDGVKNMFQGRVGRILQITSPNVTWVHLVFPNHDPRYRSFGIEYIRGLSPLEALANEAKR